MINQLFKLVIGLILVILAIWLVTYSTWLWALLIVIKASIIGVIFLMGLGLILWSLAEIKEN